MSSIYELSDEALFLSVIKIFIIIGAKQIPQTELSQKLIDSGFPTIKDKYFAFFYDK